MHPLDIVAQRTLAMRIAILEPQAERVQILEAEVEQLKAQLAEARKLLGDKPAAPAGD